MNSIKLLKLTLTAGLIMAGLLLARSVGGGKIIQIDPEDYQGSTEPEMTRIISQ